MTKLKMLVAAVVMVASGWLATGVATAYDRDDCHAIEAELLRQGAAPSVARWLGHTVAWRESGCTPQYVKDRDDWSYSRFGLNGRTTNLRRGWLRWCQADVRWDTRVLSVDVKCALEAFDRMGRRPWGR